MSSRFEIASGTKILIFGSQALAFDDESARQLRSALRDGPCFSWILATISELPSYWRSASEAIPLLRHSPSGKVLDDLRDWLRTDTLTQLSFPLPNAILTPLVVISHIIQYSHLLELVLPEFSEHQNLPPAFKRTTETVGLCTGLLSAAAASCSANQSQLQRFGAVIIRLAMLIGSLVDAQDASAGFEGESRSFSISWGSPKLGAQVTEILGHYQQAYLSVLVDENRATLTASKDTVLSLQRELRTVGVSVSDLGLRGRYHSQCHGDNLQLLIDFCDSQLALQLPDATELALSTRSNTGGDYVKGGKLHHHILQSMLVEQSDWHGVFKKLHSASTDHHTLVISFGSESCAPNSFVRRLGSRFIQLADLDQTRNALTTRLFETKDPERYERRLAENGVAVVGMSCQVPGAVDVDEFWKLLCSAKSQHTEVPGERFSFETAWRDTDPSRPWYGNFVQDYDTFDHKFFQKSPREMASTDPQHRLMLQVAYQAVEQSGYFTRPGQNKHIGCYIGVGLVDYERNIACVPANAYSATGNLKSFVAGKISHYFGWTGPGLTIDTACSSSAVSIHSACRAILAGECTAALAGGVNIMTSPEWFQNLAGASFLSPTGQCKPFDIKADGYCRGEAVGAVFLKKLSLAVADGDQILGIIGSSAVYQNQNCTPITIPNAVSLSGLFGHAIRDAGLEPKQITYVEAHGTGTPVGDPAEYESIRRVLGGSIRSDILSLGSVKGLIGHTEAASGIVALIKILLMIQGNSIPPQASFDTINPSINASLSDNMEITTSVKDWKVGFRAALINNYGASGSNACLVVTQSLQPKLKALPNGSVEDVDLKYPFWLCANDEQSLRAYSARLCRFVQSNRESAKDLSIENLAFQVSHQSNRSHRQALIFSCSSVHELEEKLAAFERGEKTVSVTTCPALRPVILCFGGQVSTFIGLNRQIYEKVAILRGYLDQCDGLCRSFGLDSIYPDIFQRSPAANIVKLQLMLFAIQYSCAKSWIDCGVQFAAVVGFSFGELTALCVSGVLSLQEAIKVVAGRARLIQEQWGVEKGAMLAVEADLVTVENLLVKSNKACMREPGAPSIACFNGPTSFTLAGSARAIDTIIEMTSKDPEFSSIKSIKLNVTNAFHSSLVEPLMKDLEDLGQKMQFKEPNIAFERATEFESTERLTARYVADHMRHPVYYSHTVQRLSQRYHDCIWLEAGSNSNIATITSRALRNPKSSHFQSVNITGDGTFDSLTEATAQLWRQGLNMSFWAHHSSQSSQYDALLLPPYQFDKSKHWIELKNPTKPVAGSVEQTQSPERPEALWTFVKYLDKDQRSVRFQVNTTNQIFEDHVSGHIIAQIAPLCPSTLQLSIVIDALLSLYSDMVDMSLQPQAQEITSHAPMSIDCSRAVWLDAVLSNTHSLVWDWKMLSTSAQNAELATTVHSSGRVIFRPTNHPELQNELAKYERLVDRNICQRLLNGIDVDELITGIKIYKRFAEIVEYSDLYRWVQKIVSKGNTSVGRVAKAHDGDKWLDTGLADSFCQVAGIFVNSMTDRSPSNVYISEKIDQWIRSPTLGSGSSGPDTWDVLAIHHRPSDKKYISDVFVFDPRNGALLECILGVHYQRVSKNSLGKVLSGVTSGPKISKTALSSSHKETEDPDRPKAPAYAEDIPKAKPPAPKEEMKASVPNISGGVREILTNVSGLEPDQIRDKSDLVELGIDSLMAMELVREIESVFKCTLPMEQFVDLTDFQSLVTCIQKTLDPVEDEVTVENSVTGQNGSVDNGPQVNGVSAPPASAKDLPATAVLGAFRESKQATDSFITQFKMGGYVDNVLPKSTELCVAHILDAFEELGCSIRSAKPGQGLSRIQYLPRHEQFVQFLYKLLEKDARLVDTAGSSTITRTNISPTTKSAQALLQDLVHHSPDHIYDHKLTYLTGQKLADCLTGRVDAIQLIFGSQEGRDIVSSMYGKSPINLAWVRQMEDFLKRLLTKLPADGDPINIFEMGAGTGGTTAILIPLLASLSVPVHYTISDLSPSMVAAARKRFKDYSFVEFRVFDIEKPPAADILHSQHIVIATNCVHATHSLKQSTKNIHDVLRADGFLIMLEMTKTLPWIDLIFGLLEGWWLFDDGRQHALVPPSVWERTLQSVGYGHIDWTEGHSPEANVQRLIIALASGSRYDRVPMSLKTLQTEPTNLTVRQTAIDAYIQQHTRDFTPSFPSDEIEVPSHPDGEVVLVTGATGSLGSHLVAHLAELPNIKGVICMNRHSSTEVEYRQQQAFKSRGIYLDSKALSKLSVIESDATKLMLGLPSSKYETLCNNVTHIVHNAWPMSVTRDIKGFASQFKIMQNIIDFACDISCRRLKGSKVGVQFISSIATVGNYPLSMDTVRVPEERVTVESILPTGYGDAKLVCEKMLDETLHKHPDRFRTMTIRIGQIAGSTSSGYWNPVEHFAFLIKSSQTLKVLPNLEGSLSWCPVTDVAATLGELLLSHETPYPVYHIENPRRQSWHEMILVLAGALDIPRENIISFHDWVHRVRQFPGSTETDNPASKLIDFLDTHFIRMSCGGLILDTEKSQEHSTTLRNMKPVGRTVTPEVDNEVFLLSFSHTTE
ncbi:polyketide synthase [Usnea florida]